MTFVHVNTGHDDFRHSRTVHVKGPFHGELFSMDLVSADVTINGTAGTTIEAAMTIAESKPGDVQCSIRDEAIQCESQSGEPFAIHAIELTLPKGVSLKVKTVSGDIDLSGMAKSNSIRLGSVSGDVTIASCTDIKTLKGKAVSGDFELTDSQFEHAAFKTVSGDIELTKCRIGRLAVDTVSGDVHREGSDITEEHIDQVSNIGHTIAKAVSSALKDL